MKIGIISVLFYLFFSHSLYAQSANSSDINFFTERYNALNCLPMPASGIYDIKRQELENPDGLKRIFILEELNLLTFISVVPKDKKRFDWNDYDNMGKYNLNYTDAMIKNNLDFKMVKINNQDRPCLKFAEIEVKSILEKKLVQSKTAVPYEAEIFYVKAFRRENSDLVKKFYKRLNLMDGSNTHLNFVSLVRQDVFSKERKIIATQFAPENGKIDMRKIEEALHKD